MTATLEAEHAPAPGPGPTPARRLSLLADRLSPALPTDRVSSWWVTIAITALGGILRFWDLGRPRAVMFDETYYMKDALSLLRYGNERQFVDDANDLILASNGDWRTIDIFKDGGCRVDRCEARADRTRRSHNVRGRGPG